MAILYLSINNEIEKCYFNEYGDFEAYYEKILKKINNKIDEKLTATNGIKSNGYNFIINYKKNKELSHRII